MITIVLDGPTGSGKSVIAKQLNLDNRIACYDVRNIISSNVLHIYKKYGLKEGRENEFWLLVRELNQCTFNKIYNREQSICRKVIVFIGSENLPSSICNKVSNVFVIKIDNYQQTYKWSIISDYKNITNNKNKLLKYAKKVNTLNNLQLIMQYGFLLNIELLAYDEWSKKVFACYEKIIKTWKVKKLYSFYEIYDKVIELCECVDI
jgi:hypothetical protein